MTSTSCSNEKNINSPQDFWFVADKLQDATMEECEEIFSYLRHASLKGIQNFLTQYRYFTIYYISDLALLIAKLNDGAIRSFLSDILCDELGGGNPKKSHPELYDNFLETIGVPRGNLNDLALKKNIDLLNSAREKLMNSKNSGSYGVGLRGMGGECVCQIYIEKLYKNLIQNPYIQENKENIDWTFWDLHVGEHDIEHREETRKLVDIEIVKNGGKELKELAFGYLYSVKQWKNFWINIYEMKDDATHDLYEKVSYSVDFSPYQESRI